MVDDFNTCWSRIGHCMVNTGQMVTHGQAPATVDPVTGDHFTWPQQLDMNKTATEAYSTVTKAICLGQCCGLWLLTCKVNLLRVALSCQVDNTCWLTTDTRGLRTHNCSVSAVHVVLCMQHSTILVLPSLKAIIID